MIKMAMQVWESDWAQATDYVVTNTYTAAELAVIQNPYALRDCVCLAPVHNRWLFGCQCQASHRHPQAEEHSGGLCYPDTVPGCV